MICPVCDRQLKSQKSIARGISPVCARKLENAKDNHDENQMKLELKDGSK
ncbi:DUF6011 domain-containing protein [Mesobacillus subterraneus]|nr:DUF6011 domain-containing protein [Mesobacillus subterraneus]WLR54859.1 DUF6011 domain-containing protein [Mesobacillus subterraneus]